MSDGRIHLRGGPFDGTEQTIPFGALFNTLIPTGNPMEWASYNETAETTNEGVPIWEFEALQGPEMPGVAASPAFLSRRAVVAVVQRTIQYGVVLTLQDEKGDELASTVMPAYADFMDDGIARADEVLAKSGLRVEGPDSWQEIDGSFTAVLHRLDPQLPN